MLFRSVSQSRYGGARKVGASVWDRSIVGFKITDERYKPSNDLWHVKGEFPPAGTECEVFSGKRWYKTYIVGMSKSGTHCIYDSREFETSLYNGEDDPANFRPLLSERERFIDSGIVVIGGSVANRAVLGQLYDAGYRTK